MCSKVVQIVSSDLLTNLTSVETNVENELTLFEKAKVLKGDSVLNIVKQDGVALYKLLASVPIVTKAELESRGSLLCLNSYWSQRDISMGQHTVFSKQSLLEQESLNFIAELDASSISKFLISSPKLSSGNLAKVFEVKEEKEDIQVLQLWSSDNCMKSWKVADFDKHGKIYGADDQFGCMELNTAGSHLLYIAEEKKSKGLSFFTKISSSDDTKPQSEVGNEHELRDKWGEQLKDKHKPVLCVLQLSSDIPDVDVVTCEDEDISIGQAVWRPGTEPEVVFVGWYNAPYRLGAIYCSMRRSALFSWKPGSKPVRLTDSDQSVRSPRFSADGASVLFVRNPASGAHRQCCQLCELDMTTREVRVIVDVVDDASTDDFPGLYLDALPRRCWAVESLVVCNTEWRSQQALLAIDAKTGVVYRLGANLTGSFTVLDVLNDVVVVSYSTPVQPPSLLAVRLTMSGGNVNTLWSSVGRISPRPVALGNLRYRVLKHLPDTDKGELDFESIVIWKQEQEAIKRPTIVYPHGGPHGAFCTSYINQMAGLAAAGFIVLMVNYRGSTGFGQNGVNSLPGKIGTNDVADCYKALRDLEKVHLGAGPQPDPACAFVCGGSHGGFLTAHLIAQHPQTFKAACCRNPVIHLPSMVGVSDIPDWVAVESGIPFEHKWVPTVEHYQKMRACSPLSLVHQIKTPVLIMLGGADLRVPPSQGMMLHRLLKSHGVENRLMYYPDDCHPLNSVKTEADCFLNIIVWFLSHI